MSSHPARFPYFYSWPLRKLYGKEGSPYYGRHCRVIAHNRPRNTRLIELEDGSWLVVSGNALRRVR